MRPERADLSPGKKARSYSISSEVPSLPGHALLHPPASVNPEPAYIAISAASQLVSSELETDGVTISPSALAQLNGFLDNILFNILLAAKSTKLSLLRPAINNVLKPKLGKAAIAGADEELREYMGDDEDEDENLETNLDRETKRDFDLELAWKLARLRCMVYSRLGDLEEDDEDEYIERDNLDERGGRPRRFSSHPSRVTTASAIFLTSVIEFLAEQALAHAALATQKKLSRSRASQGNTPDPTPSLFFSPDRIVVNDADMRHLGRDSPLQKLWRGWRHQVRLPTDPASRPISPGSLKVPGHSAKASISTSDDTPESDVQHQPSVAEVLHENDPVWIPLPMTNNDIDEVGAPALSPTHDEENMTESERSPGIGRSRRPRSLERFPSEVTPLTPVSLDEKMSALPDAPTRPMIQHTRRRSLPTSPALTPHAMSSNVAGFNSTAGEWLMKGSQARDTEDGRIPGPATLEQSSGTFYSSPEGDRKPGKLSDGATVMAGTFPPTQTLGEGGSVHGANMLMRDADDVPTGSDSASFTEAGLDRGGAPASHVAVSTHESTALERVLPTRTHPQRTSSKASDNSSPHSQQHSPTDFDSSGPASKVVTGYYGAPLAPLQKMTAEARNTPEEAFPDTPTTEAQKRQGQAIFLPESGDIRSRTSSKSSHHTKRSSSSSKLLGFDREQQSAMQIGPDRAGVQRMYPVPGVQEVNGQVTRPSTSHGMKDRRPGTAGSHLSSLKQGGLGRASLDTIGNSRGQKQSMEQDEKKQSLDNLIRSKETLKFTLTPQTMRQMEAPGSPRQKTQTQELADFFRDTAPPGHVKPEEAENKPCSPAEGMNGLRANPPEPLATTSIASKSVEISRPGSVEQRMPTSPTAKSVRSQYKPRDAKVEKPSTRDLADFAKSTGPEDPGQLPKAVSGASTQPRRSQSSATRFQARDPIVKGATSDLIDFIREGPPRGKGDGTHRIPRTVAPFRTTMDSDELNALGPLQDPAGRNSSSSNHDGSIVTKSTVNSRTGLMDSTNRTAFPSNSSNLGASQVPKRNAEESTQPKRKQRRARDPYAIDMGSDDEIDDVSGKPPKYEDESLIDFLRNTSPSSESQFQPQPLVLSSKYVATQPPNVLKKPVDGGFRERLRRTASTNSLGRNGGAKPSPSTSDGPNTSTRSGSKLRPSSPHLVQSGSRFDRYKPTQTTYAAHVERNRQRATPQGQEGGDNEGSLSRFFSRKRRVAA